MADKRSKAEKKVRDLNGQNASVISKILKTLDKVINGMSDGKSGKKKDDKQDRALFDKPQNSIITGYAKPGSVGTPKAPTKFIADAFGKFFQPDEDKEAPVKQPGWWKKLIGPALLILGGLASFVFGLMSDGPLKGFLHTIGKVGVMGGIKWMAVKVGGKLLKVVKWIPLIGSLMDFASAYTRFKGGDLGGGLIDLMAGFVTLVPGVGPWIGLGLNVLNGILDAKGESGKKIKQQGTGFFALVLRALLPFVKVLARVPFLGSVISLGLGYMRFKGGNILGGIIDVLSGVAALFPGPGTAISWGLGILNAVLDATGGSEKAKEPGGTKNVLKLMIEKLGKAAIGMTPIGWIIGFIKGVKLVMKGDFKGGLWKMAEWIGPLGMIANWLFGPKGKMRGEKGEPGFLMKMAMSLGKALIGMTPIGWVIGFIQGVKKVAKGDFKGGLWAMAEWMGPIGMLASWMFGPKEGEKPEKGQGSFLWNAIKTLGQAFIGMTPIGWVIGFTKGIQKVAKGDFKGGLWAMAEWIGPMGMIANWLYGPEPGKEKEESIGSKGGFWSSILNFILSVPPLRQIVQIGKGISAVMDGNFMKAGKHFMYAIPYIGAVLQWFGVGESLGEPNQGDLPKKEGFLTKVFKGAMKWGWGTVKWLLGKIFWPIKKILEWTGFLDDMPSGHTEDMPGGGGGAPKKVTAAEMIKRSKIGAIKQYAGTWKSIGSVGRWVARKFLDKETEAALDAAAGLTDAPASGMAGAPSQEKAKSATEEVYGAAKSAVSTLTNPLKTAYKMGGKLLKGDLVGSFKEGWSGIKNQASAVWNTYKGAFTGLAKGAKAAWSKIKDVSGKLWGGIKERFPKLAATAEKAWKGIKGVAGSVWGGIKSYIGGFGKAAKGAWGGIKEYAGGWWDAVSGAIGGVGKAAKAGWQGIKDVASGGIDVVKSYVGSLGKAWGKAWEGVKGVGSGAWKVLKGDLSGFKDMASSAWKGISGAASEAWKGIKGAVSGVGKMDKGAWKGIKGVASGVWSGIKGAVSGLGKAASKSWSGIKSVASSAWSGIKSVSSSLWSGTKKFFSGAKNVASKAWGGIKKVGSAYWKGLKGFYGGIWNGAKKAAGAVTKLAKKGWETVKGGYNDLANAYKKEGVKGVLKEGTKKIANAGKSIVSGAKSLAKKAWGWLRGSPYAWEILGKASDKIVEGTKKLSDTTIETAKKKLPLLGKAASGLWGSIKSGFKTITTPHRALAKGIVSTGSKIWGGIKKGFTDISDAYQKGGLKGVAGSLRKKFTEGTKNIASKVSSIAKSAGGILSKAGAGISSIWSKWTGAAKKVQQTVADKMGLTGASKRKDPPQIAIAKSHLYVSRQIRTNIKSILGILARHHAAASGKTTYGGIGSSPQDRRDLVQKTSSSKLEESVTIQRDMLKELREGQLVQTLNKMGKVMQERLDIIAENTGNKPGAQFIGMPGQSNSSGPNNSPGRADRISNRDMSDWTVG